MSNLKEVQFEKFSGFNHYLKHDQSQTIVYHFWRNTIEKMNGRKVKYGYNMKTESTIPQKENEKV